MMLLKLFLLFGAMALASGQGDVYLVGAGIGDVTGPSAQVNLFGFAKVSMIGHGIHLRQFSRAYVVADIANSTRVVFVSIDNGMASTLVKTQVVNKLKSKYGDLYTESNVCISGTHSHSAVGGFFQYFLYQVTSLGYVKAATEALVDGIVLSIDRAHNSLQPGRILYNQGELHDANINRSPTSYLVNPDKDKYSGDTDKNMFLVKIVDINGEPIAAVNWFAVHPTSMNYTNDLVSGDNKGYASYLFEREMNPGKLHGKGDFVAAFAQSNCGDVSPNTAGPLCRDTGLPCDNYTSTCNGRSQKCIGFGPGVDMVDSTQIIGQKQYDKAKELFDMAADAITGPVRFIHQHLNFSDIEVALEDGQIGHTCGAALAHTFAAGCTDGAGAFDFHQRTVYGEQKTAYDMVINLLERSTDELIECHKPKAILLPTSQMHRPYQWTAEIIPLQILAVGNLIILAVPGEFTTMAGRRLREAVLETLQNANPSLYSNAQVVIAGLSNSYTHYISTFEEYQEQRYEAGSTLYGPHTLAAHIQQYNYLATNLALNQTVEAGPDPPNLLPYLVSLLNDVPFDLSAPGTKIGDVLQDVNPQYSVGSTVIAKFACGNPRNNLMLEESYLTVEQANESEWIVIANDAEWNTRFRWQQLNSYFEESQCTVEWDIPAETAPGTYRIRHIGHKKSLQGTISRYESLTSTFQVIGPSFMQLVGL